MHSTHLSPFELCDTVDSECEADQNGHSDVQLGLPDEFSLRMNRLNSMIACNLRGGGHQQPGIGI